MRSQICFVREARGWKQTNMHVFWSETRIGGANPCRHNENMQTLIQKTTGWTKTFRLWDIGANHRSLALPLRTNQGVKHAAAEWTKLAELILKHRAGETKPIKNLGNEQTGLNRNNYPDPNHSRRSRTLQSFTPEVQIKVTACWEMMKQLFSLP